MTKDLTDYGAVGGNVSRDTKAMTDAIGEAVSPQGSGVVTIPSNGVGYDIERIDCRGIDGLEFVGGPRSILNVCASSGVWANFTGASHIGWNHLQVNQHGGTDKPDFVFVVAAGLINPVTRHTFNRVRCKVRAAKDVFYGYGMTGLSIQNCDWRQMYAGEANANPSKRTSCLHLTGTNDRGFIDPQLAVGGSCATHIDLTLSNFDEFASLDGSYATAAVFDRVQGMVATECGFYSQGEDNITIWNMCEGLTFEQPEFRSASGAAFVNKYPVHIGGGLNALLTFQNPFLSVIKDGGAYFALDKKIGNAPLADGGLYGFYLNNPDVGGNPNSSPIVGLTFNYTAQDRLDPWIGNSRIDCQDMDVITAGDVDLDTQFRACRELITPPGALCGGFGSSARGLDVVRKGVSQTSQGITFTKDDTFTFPIRPYQRAQIEIDLLVFGLPSADIKLDVSAPVGCVPTVSYEGPEPNTVASAATLVNMRSVAAGTPVVIGCDGLSQQRVRICIDAVNAGNSGDIILLWGQNVAASTPTQVMAGSSAVVIRA